MFSEQRGRSRKGVLVVVVVVSVVVSESTGGGGVVKIGSRFWFSGGIGDPRTGTLVENYNHVNRRWECPKISKWYTSISYSNSGKTCLIS